MSLVYLLLLFLSKLQVAFKYKVNLLILVRRYMILIVQFTTNMACFFPFKVAGKSGSENLVRLCYHLRNYRSIIVYILR